MRAQLSIWRQKLAAKWAEQRAALPRWGRVSSTSMCYISKTAHQSPTSRKALGSGTAQGGCSPLTDVVLRLPCMARRMVANVACAQGASQPASSWASIVSGRAGGRSTVHRRRACAAEPALTCAAWAAEAPCWRRYGGW